MPCGVDADSCGQSTRGRRFARVAPSARLNPTGGGGNLCGMTIRFRRPVALGIRRSTRVLLAALVAAVSGACATGAPPEPTATDRPAAPAAPGDTAPPQLLLVSIDGFRADYLDPKVTPNLLALAERGVRAEALIPSFPTKTFPNHYTIVTGLRPDHHGLVANNIWDPQMEERYGLGDREAVRNPDWYGGVPVWVTAEREGRTTAPLFWPGAEAPIDGVWPTHWLAYDGDMPHRDRVEWVLDRLDRDRASFATLYFDAVDVAGHDFGPEAPETRAAAARVDTAIGLLRVGLARRDLDEVNVIVVSDHGMSPLSRDRVFFLDDYVDVDRARVIDWSPVLALWPDSADVDEIYEALRGAHPHVSVYRPEEVPDRYEFGAHDRVAPIIGIADPGWSITTRDYFARSPERYDGGNHGYYHRSPDMRALFIAAGPAFRSGVVVPPFPNVDVYELIMEVLDLPAAPGDGRLARVADLLAPEAQKNRGRP